MRNPTKRRRQPGQAVTDALLLRQVRDRDEAAFGELYRRHVDVARVVARSLLSSETEADDVVADAFTRVLSILQRGGGPEEAFRPYLLTCVRHACYDRTQGIARSTPTDPDDVADLGDARQRGQVDAEDGSNNADLMARAFASLPERWQLVLWSTEVDGRRPADLAEELGLAPGAVASLAYRAREGLTEAFLAAHLQRRAAPACAAVRPRLAAFVRDNVPDREEAAIQDHLDHCAACQALVSELRELNRPLRGVLVPAVAGISAGAYAATASGGALLPRLIELLHARPVLSGAATASVAVVATATLSGVVPLRPASTPPSSTVVTAVVMANGSSASVPIHEPDGAPVPGDGRAPVPPILPPGSSPDPAPTGIDPTVTVAALVPPASTAPATDASPVDASPVTVPAVTVPALPAVTVPALPAVTEPITLPTLPPVTLPAVTLPAVTLPAVTLPPVTVPPVTVPAITLPPVTVPPVTVPAITVPPVTVPPVTVPLGGKGCAHLID